MTRVCIVCKTEFETTDENTVVCYDCFMDGSYQAKLDKERDEQEKNRKDYLAFRKHHCDDDTNPDLYEDDESRQAWEDAEDEKLWSEVFYQERLEREDNEPPSGSTDLDNPGGTTFCF